MHVENQVKRSFGGAVCAARASRRVIVSTRASAAPAVVAAPAAVFNVNGEVLPVPADVAPLFTPVKVGKLQLSNRIAYAPLTRCRAIGNVHTPAAATYYGQRSVQGTLLISEATSILQEARGYPNTPGIWSPEQLKSWEPVVQAVHGKGAHLFLQLWHCGRASHQEYQPGGVAPMSSSAVAITSPEFQVYTSKGPVPYPVPREATKDEIKTVIKAYGQAAKNAIAVGCDGVEVHGANGYLIDQFIKDSINKRTDEYGGSIEKRCRFALEVLAEVCAAVGPERVGVRITPFTTFLDALDSTPYATHIYLLEKLNAMGLAYLHMVEPRILGNVEVDDPVDTLKPFREVYKGTFITAGGFDRLSGPKAVASGAADLVAYGRWYLSNPDLHKRFLLNAPLNKYDRDTFYSPDPVVGYTDYPTLEQAKH